MPDNVPSSPESSILRGSHDNSEITLESHSDSGNDGYNISVVIPLSPKEDEWQSLVDSLYDISEISEIILVSSKTPLLSRAQTESGSDTGSGKTVILSACEESPEIFRQAQYDNELDTAIKSRYDIKIITSPKPGRAEQMNLGASEATGEYIWFLHADSRLNDTTLPSLLASIKSNPDALHYFNLGFYDNKSRFMKLNEAGAKFRSNILKCPFGDQGFCIRKELFDKIGGYPESLPYGEDHVFVWHARQQGIKIRPTGTKLLTSARKYNSGGWFKVTITHQYLWLKQVIPELFKLLFGRRFNQR